MRALFDCGVVRARWNHPGYRQLRERGLASYKWTTGQTDPTYQLTPRGHNLAVDLFR